MRFSTVAFAGALSVASAYPSLTPMAATFQPDYAPGPLSQTDASVVQLALFLENLEYSLYTGGFENFTDAQYTAQGFPAGFRDGVGLTASQEGTHMATLASVLSANNMEPVPSCTYKFPYTDPKSFVALANMITTVGIGAYLGGAMLLMDNPNLLTAAASILTVEARHDSFLRSGTGGSPFPSPFDTALTAEWAYTLANMFVESCPKYLPLTVLPTLTLTSPTPPEGLQPPTPAGSALEFSWDPSTFTMPYDSSKPLYIALINQDAMPYYQNVNMTGKSTGEIPVPKGIEGVAFAVLTTYNGGLNYSELSSYGTLAGPAEVVLS